MISKTADELAELRRLYEDEEWTVEALSLELGHSTGVIRRLLKEARTTMRRQGDKTTGTTPRHYKGSGTSRTQTGLVISPKLRRNGFR